MVRNHAHVFAWVMVLLADRPVVFQTPGKVKAATKVVAGAFKYDHLYSGIFICPSWRGIECVQQFQTQCIRLRGAVEGDDGDAT